MACAGMRAGLTGWKALGRKALSHRHGLMALIEERAPEMGLMETVYIKDRQPGPSGRQFSAALLTASRGPYNKDISAIAHSDMMQVLKHTTSIK